MLLRLAQRNLWRRKRRTLITAFSIAFGAWFASSNTGVSISSFEKLINSGAKMGFGHISIEANGYHLSPAFDRPLHGVAATRAQLANIEGMSAAATRIAGPAMLAAGSKSFGGTLIGVDPGEESADTNLFFSSIVQGEKFTTTDGRSAVIGTLLAERLGLEIGRKLIFTAVDVNGELVSDVVRVTGIFKTGTEGLDGGMAVVPIDTLRKTINYGPDDATHVSVFVGTPRMVEEVHARVSKAVTSTSAEVITWRKSQPGLAGFVDLNEGMTMIMMLLVAFLIAIGIVNTMMMSIVERTREIGAMMAVGMESGTVFRLILIESALLAGVGLLIGVLVCVPWYWFMHTTGLDITSSGGDTAVAGVAMDPILKMQLYPMNVVAIVAALFVFTLLAGAYPAYRAGRIPPLDSIRKG